MLTPEYASPEQIKGDAVTTATDIYALGVVLYQLLSGRWPYRLTAENTSEIFQAICEQVPEKPSIAVMRRWPNRPPTVASPSDGQLSDPVLVSGSSSSPTPEQIARARGLLPRQLRRSLAGDLDTIIMMTLQKEPERRYRSAKQFSDDLHNYLKGMPVQAHYDTATYRVIKFVRRHVAAVATGFLLLWHWSQPPSARLSA